MRILFATTQAYLPQRVGGSQLSTHELSIDESSRRKLAYRARSVPHLEHPNLRFLPSPVWNREIQPILIRHEQ